MNEFENENEIKKTIQNTQMLIRNSMEQHKKTSKQLHSQIKKKKKTIELIREKVGKLIVEKEKYESEKKNSKGDKNDEDDDPEVAQIIDKIKKEMEEKQEIDEKIAEIKADILVIKNEMGGLNATQHQQDKYEKHIISLENRLDKANQKFNESIEYDKKLRAEIDKLRKERFFFENIYKKLEKDLEGVRNDISDCLKKAYANYEERDANQEQFESLKAAMLKSESEYVNMLQELSNKQNMRENRGKNADKKDNKNLKNNELSNLNDKAYPKSKRNDNLDSNKDKIIKCNNLKYKFEKLAEFTGHPELADFSGGKDGKDDGVKIFCENFKKDDEKNYELFQAISMMSSEAKRLEFEIKEMEKEIEILKKVKNSQEGIEKRNMISELKTKTQKLIEKKDKYDNEYKNYCDEFNTIRHYIEGIFKTLECREQLNDVEKVDYEGEITEENALDYLSKIEQKLKNYLKILELEKKAQNQNPFKSKYDPNKGYMNNKQLNDKMNNIFNSMENTKSKTLDLIRDNKNDEFRIEKLKEYSENFVEELLKKADKDDNAEKKNDKKSKRNGNNVLPPIG